MKIGITEYGDAGVDFRWENKLKEIDGVILITKNLNDTFIKKVLNHMSEIPIVVHVHVPDGDTQEWNQMFRTTNSSLHR